MKSKIIFVLSLTVSVGLAVATGYDFCTRPAIAGAPIYALVCAYILLTFAGIIFCDLAHEGAHLLVGACCRMGVKLGAYRIFRPSSVTVNPKGDGSMRLRMTAVSCAGLAVNAICLCVGLAAAVGTAVPAALSFLMPYSAYLLLLNGIPDDRNGAKNDGMVVWELIKGDDSSAVMLGILRIQGLVNGGTPLSEVPEDSFFNLPQLAEDDLNFILLTRLRYEYYLSRGDGEKAQKYLSRYKEIEEYLPEEYRDRRGA